MAQRSEASSETAPTSPSQRPGSAAAAAASALAQGDADALSVESYITALGAADEGAAAEAAEVLESLVKLKPERLAPHIEPLVKLLLSAQGPGALCCARCLPVLARVVPAKVAKQLKTMQHALPTASLVAQDGLVRTFVALCVASVTYQKRLIDSFEMALRTAPPSQLPAWVEHILPALKGEPYAQARAIVEQRLPAPELPREVAQQIADFLGVKLRPLPERK